VPGPALHLPHGQQGPAQLEGHRQILVVPQGLLQRLDRACHVAAGREQQAPAAGGGGQGPGAAGGAAPPVEPAQQPFGPVQVTQADHGLDVVGVKAPRRRLGQADGTASRNAATAAISRSRPTTPATGTVPSAKLIR
jgi:hypothetical protein